MPNSPERAKMACRSVTEQDVKLPVVVSGFRAKVPLDNCFERPVPLQIPQTAMLAECLFHGRTNEGVQLLAVLLPGELYTSPPLSTSLLLSRGSCAGC
jgi:hypothetical protein